MGGFSVPSFIINYFAFVKCVIVIHIIPFFPTTACELYWQQTLRADFCILPSPSLTVTPASLLLRPITEPSIHIRRAQQILCELYTALLKKKTCEL